MDKSKNLYEILGVNESANSDEIKKTFRDLSKKHHPDKNRGNKGAEERFKEISAAHDILKDDKKRAQYDQMRKYGLGGNSGFNYEDFGNFSQTGGKAGFDPNDLGSLNDLIEQMLGKNRAGSRRRRTPPKTPGNDVEATIQVPFMTAALGGSVTVYVPKSSAYETITLSVKIPAGINDGEKIRLRGQGEPSLYDGPAGDMLVVVKIEPHPQYKRNDLDILLEAPLNFAQAALGTSIPAQTIHGKTIHVKIKPGTSSGAILRIPGMGIHKEHRRGDMLITLHIQAPANLTPGQRQLIEKLASEMQWPV